ncbi:hypothetical protein RN001_016241 [Aquatica leii]|uniref:Uncharacterized protein n=1 Tax=Aquatica leii TaxID=1421715 RepID=A0AAN7SBA7_9COLE|nr:hypothetical protein RN001_016241 [Aquatica leii]
MTVRLPRTLNRAQGDFDFEAMVEVRSFACATDVSQAYGRTEAVLPSRWHYSDIILDEVELSINSLDSIDQPTQMNEPDLSGLLDIGTSDVCTIDNCFSEVIETDTRLVASANIQEGSSTHTSSDIAEHQNEQLGCDELHSSFSEDSDDSVKDAEYVASSTSSTSSSCSGCSECSNSEAENINPNLTQGTNIHSETRETKVKKRKLGHQMWKKNVWKRLRNTDREYVNNKTKKIFAESMHR